MSRRALVACSNEDDVEAGLRLGSREGISNDYGPDPLRIISFESSGFLARAALALPPSGKTSTLEDILFSLLERGRKYGRQQPVGGARLHS